MASNLTKIRVGITGIRPLLFHAFGPDSIPLDGRKERTGVAGNDPEEWKRTVLVTKERQLYLKPTYPFGMLRDASRYTKSGKGSIMTKVAATLQILDDKVLVDDRFLPDPISEDQDELVYLDVSSVRNPSTKARNVRYRVACKTGWTLHFNIMFDRTIVSRNEMEAVCNDAGALVGIGDGRSIGFGRFTVSSFEELD